MILCSWLTPRTLKMCGYCDDKLGYLNARGIFSQLGINDRLINRALTMQLVTLLPSSDHPKEIPD